jgi:hypothetical protein
MTQHAAVLTHRCPDSDRYPKNRGLELGLGIEVAPESGRCHKGAKTVIDENICTANRGRAQKREALIARASPGRRRAIHF